MWIRFGRNEPRAPSIPLDSNREAELDLHRYRRDGTLLLFFAPLGGIETCQQLLDILRGAPLEEQEAELLVVSENRRDLAAHFDLTIAYDGEGKLRAMYAGLMATDATGKPMLFVLDRDGAPVYAWVGDCNEGQDIADDLMRKLQSASFLCPECSVPDPASVAMWDAVY